jgi:hypothetical protein
MQIHILHEGEALLNSGQEFNKLFHVAQGRIEVSEVVDNNATASSMSDAASAHEINLEEEFKQVRTSFSYDMLEYLQLQLQRIAVCTHATPVASSCHAPLLHIQCIKGAPDQ